MESELQAAAQHWGQPHDYVYYKLAVEITQQRYGEQCAKIIECLGKAVADVQELQTSTELNDEDFRKCFSLLCHKDIINTENEISINSFTFASILLEPHYILFAQKFAEIPQDIPLINTIVRKILDENTLSPRLICTALATSNPDFEMARIQYVTDYLIRKNVLLHDPASESVTFNIPNYMCKLRLEALEQLVENQDHRVLEVVRVLFSDDIRADVLESLEPTPIDQPTADEIAARLELEATELQGILSILGSPEVSLLSSDYQTMQPAMALRNFKARKVAGLLAEIGYPLARRVVNTLLRHETVEAVKLCDILLLPKEDGLALLEKLRKLGVLACDIMEDAPHTQLRRRYAVWKIDFAGCVNNASAYLLAVLGTLLFQLAAERAENEGILKRNEELMAAHERSQRKAMESRINILQNTIMSLTLRYVQIYQI